MITDEFVSRLAERAQQAETLRRLPAETIADLTGSGFTELLVPAVYGGREAAFSEILDPVRRMAHGCTSSAWTIGFYALHNWMLALFPEEAQSEAFSSRPFLAPAPLAPTGRGLPEAGGVRLSGRWSWATGVMDANWIMVGALCGPDNAIYPALALLPASDITVDDVWHTDGMCATGSNDVVITDAPSYEPRTFNHLLGECGVSFLAVEKLAKAHRKDFPASLDNAPLLLPTDNVLLRRSLDHWFESVGVQPRVVAEFEDSALLKQFGHHGEGIFAAPSAIESEIIERYRVRVVGRTEQVVERFYAITVERRIKHPAVRAISDAAQGTIFG